MRYTVLSGRVLYALIFVLASFGHFSQQTIAYAAAQGVPLASLAVPFSGILSLAGGLSIAAGYRAKWGAWALVAFLVPVTFTMHAFWSVTDPGAAQIQQVMFLKNIALIGSALFIAYFGSGPLSLDNRTADVREAVAARSIA